MTPIQSSVVILSGALLYGAPQNAPPADMRFTFDVASVKPSGDTPAGAPGEKTVARKQPGGRRGGGPGTDDPGRIHYPNTTLKMLLVEACGVERFQIQGPGWLDQERFDVEATMPPETTKAQFHAMLQNLLVD